jgi:hypothetical protein
MKEGNVAGSIVKVVILLAGKSCEDGLIRWALEGVTVA